jgi:hypothetical protein
MRCGCFPRGAADLLDNAVVREGATDEVSHCQGSWGYGSAAWWGVTRLLFVRFTGRALFSHHTSPVTQRSIPSFWVVPFVKVGSFRYQKGG